MITLNQVKEMDKRDVINKLQSSRILTYGVYEEPLIKNWEEVKEIGLEEELPMKLVVGLNNADTTGLLLDVLYESAEKVFLGMEIVSHLVDAKESILYLPEYASNIDSIREKAAEHSIKVDTGIINRRTYKGCVLNHIVTMSDIVDCLEDKYTDDILVSVNGERLKRVSRDTKVSKLIESEDIKGIEMGYRFFDSKALELTIGEVGIANGLLRVITDKECIVQSTRDRLLTYRKQSCGRCVFCREGLLQLHSMHKDISEGKGKVDYLDFTDEIGSAMTFSTPCSLGQNSSIVALTGLSNFRPEYEKHIKKKQCQAGACFSSVTFYIDPKTCTGCGECVDVCPVDCIEGKSGYIHMIDSLDCTACGKCTEVCEEEAIHKTDGKLPKLPNRLTKCGRFKKR
ncbi:MAG: NADH-ubiquinone oxidoreductase-F iron-sulfur binding region domain-containing protein [Suipraeoptans sp.]